MVVKRALVIHAVCSAIVILFAAGIGGAQQAVSAAAGAILVMASVGLMMWSIHRLFEKKSVALAGMVIVIKYLLLAATIYWFSLQPWANVFWLAAGVASVVMTAVFYCLTADTSATL